MKRTALVVDTRGPSEFTSLWQKLSASGWETDLAHDHCRAHDLITTGCYDVVVVSTSNPVSETAALLGDARIHTPKALRIAAMPGGHRATGPIIALSHQAISAPTDVCTVAHLLDVVELSSELLTSDFLRATIASMGELPALSETISALDRLLENPDVILRDVADLVSTDVALTAKILQLVNSPYFGLMRRITDVGEAVSFLGLATLRTLALSVDVFRAWSDRVDRKVVSKLFDHANATANAAAERVIPALRADAYCAGLLHVVGDLALEDVDLGPSIRRKAEETGQSRSELEQLAFGTTHAEIGAALLLQWGLPLEVVFAVASHHEPPSTDETEDLVDIADAVRGVCGHARSDDPEIIEVDDE